MFFPYNYFVSCPSYRADETGQIRMVMVHQKDEKCPADAPIVIQVSILDVNNMLKTIEKRKKYEREFEGGSHV